MWFSNFTAMPAIGTVFVRRSGLKQNSPKGDFNWAWERRSVHTEDIVADHCMTSSGDNIHSFEHCTFWKTFVTRKIVPFLRRGCIVTFQIPPSWIKVSRKQKASTCFHAPLPWSLRPQNMVWQYRPTVTTVEPRYFEVPREMEKKFEIAGFRNNRGGVKFVTMNWSFVVIWYCV